MSKFIVEYYDQGKQAFRDNLTLLDNPFKIEGSASRWSWEAGFTDEWYKHYMENTNAN